MKIGFIGLGNVGGKLAGNLVRNGFALTVHDLARSAAQPLLAQGAQWAESPRAVAAAADMIITCLPSPAAGAAVMEAADGVLAGLRPGTIWGEMSTTDEAEVRRLALLVEKAGGQALDCPVSGGCHRAATGNIAIFVGGERAVFERALPVLKVMGRRILHTGGLGSASILKVLTNYLATVNLLSLCEALATVKALNMDLAVAYEAILASSGNSFVHETESQVILNGSRNINFTLGLALKDVSLFQKTAAAAGVPLEMSPLVVKILADGEKRYGAGEWSPNIIRRLEDACGIKVLAGGFPAQLTDDEPAAAGAEVKVRGRA